MTGILILIAFLILFGACFLGIFKKAGKETWKAFIPFYREYTILEIIKKPKWWMIMLFIPIVGLFYWVSLMIDLAKCFRKYRFWQAAASVVTPFIYMPYLGHSDERFIGPDLLEDEKPYKKSVGREWADALIFAIVAAHLIRVFLIEAYKIPTSSMEGTLQIGDYMFVSKLHYGSRVPNTPLALPFMHHTIPFTKSRAYSEAIKLSYKRLPGFQKIKRNDIVVFNIPFEHDMQSPMSKAYNRGIKYASRPVDKREHYIKRAVGVPGDKIEVKDKQLYVNGEAALNPEKMQHAYQVSSGNTQISDKTLRKHGVRVFAHTKFSSINPNRGGAGLMGVRMTDKTAEKLNDLSFVQQVQPLEKPVASFPENAGDLGWTGDNYGPVQIPAKGETIQLNSDNINIYKTAIEVYEGNDLEINENEIKINGAVVDGYTFKMDYFWLMGDNRDNSLDSREWGFVPEDHVVGKPLFVFFSSEGGKTVQLANGWKVKNEGIKWNRLFKKAQDMN